ncbi:hypothetical protein [Isoptericola sp. BMS4]|uniref:hypothetical protein n=1 Tax=Isoptericola sp. BMS4 TaxID=2527875 RepID=UPI0014249038|nr:hypothetical protein [Isoptericola sp. BMS4]
MSTSGGTTGVQPLPEQGLLLHIGLMKTGTTSLQNAAYSLRPELLERGVRYPGRHKNHRSAMNDFMGHAWGWGTTPVHGAWAKLRAEIDADTENRIWIGHEFVANADDATAARWRTELGERARVVVTLRNYASILPSVWQQQMKDGSTISFDSWLTAILSEDPGDALRSYKERHDQGDVVARWAEAFGPENVTVVVVDKSTPELLFDAFESMLGLEHGLLSTAKLDGNSSNRGMSVEEAELLRALNHRLREQLTWHEYCKWLRDAGANTLLKRRRLGDHDTRFVLPTWAAERAHERAVGYVEQIEASGVRVVGDLGLLSAEVPSVDHPMLSAETVPIDAAAEAILGVMRQGRRDEARLSKAREALKERSANASAVERAAASPVPALESVSGRELARELGGRLKRRLGRR